MDIAQLSNEVTLALAPFLPTLLAVGGKVVEGIENKIGEDAWDKVKTLWSKLHPKVEANPFAKRAVEEVAAAPNDQDLQTAMRVELKKLLAADENFAREVTKIWVENKTTITNAIAAGHQSAAFAAEVSKSVVNTGSNPIFNITHNHPVASLVGIPQNLAPSLAAAEPAKPITILSSLNQLPPLPAKFTGRVKVLEDLEKELAADHAVGAAISGVLTNLQGAPGVGKTALATVLAHRLKDRYPDAQIYQNLRGAGADMHGQHSGTMLKPVAPADAMQSIIHAFHPEAKLPEDEAELSAIYRSVLAKAGRVLLFLDNAADGNQVRPLLPPPNCLLLVTSRQQLNLDELVEHHLDYLLPEEAQELLLKLAPKLKGHEHEAAELCGNLPLALKTVAGMVKSQSIVKPSEILARLRNKMDKLAAVDAAFQVSYEVLAKESQKRWALLSVFPASFDLPAAVAVWNEGVVGAPQRAYMQVLVNASLVEQDEPNSRFRLHDLVRQFCDGKLTTDIIDDGHLAYAKHYTKVLEEANKLYQAKGKMTDGLALFDSERAHIEAAYAWLDGREDEAAARQILDLMDNVTFIGSLRFYPRQLIALMESYLRAARYVNDRQKEGWALGNLGIAYKNLGDMRKAIGCQEPALVIARETGDRRGEGNALGNLGNVYHNLGETSKALEFYKEALVVSREIGDRRAEGIGLSSLGDIYNGLGDPRRAIEYHEQRLVIAREIGDVLGEGKTYIGLGNAYEALGDTPKAIEFYEKQLVIVREIGDRRGEGIALYNSALVHDSLGNRAEAITRAETALKIFEAIEHPGATQVRAALAEWRGQA